MRNNGAFEAQLNGVSVLVTPDRDGLLIGRRVIDYADIQSFGAENFRAVIRTSQGTVELTRMGGDLTPFLYKLGEIYGGIVTDALFQTAQPLLTAKGQFNGEPARVALYPDCVFLLPAGAGCVRLPLCYCQEPARQGYDLCLRDGQQTALLGRLGYDTDNLVRGMGDATLALDAETAAALNAFSGCSGVEGRRLAPYMSRGRAVTAAELEGTALLEAMEKAIAEYTEPQAEGAAPAAAEETEEPRHAAWELYTALKQRLGPENVALGLLPGEEPVVWFAAFHGGSAMAEYLAQEATATFLYRYDGEDELFLDQLNRGLEATGLRREIIALPEEKLRRDTAARIAVSVSPALRTLRDRFAGRVIHSDPDAWKSKVLAHFK